MKLVFTRLARQDLLQLRQFIGAYDLKAARVAAARIKTAATQLMGFPLLGRPVTGPDGTVYEEIRELIIRHGSSAYLLRYQVVLHEIRVLRVWHSRSPGDTDRGKTTLKSF